MYEQNIKIIQIIYLQIVRFIHVIFCEAKLELCYIPPLQVMSTDEDWGNEFKEYLKSVRSYNKILLLLLYSQEI